MNNKISSKEFIKKRNSTIIKSIDDNLYTLFDILYQSINTLHNTNKDKKSWGIILKAYVALLNDNLFIVKNLKKDELPSKKPICNIPLDGYALDNMTLLNYESEISLIRSIVFFIKIFNNEEFNKKSIHQAIFKNKNIINFNESGRRKENKIYKFINFIFSFHKKKYSLDFINAKFFINLFLNRISANFINIDNKPLKGNDYDYNKRLELYNLGSKLCLSSSTKEDLFIICFLLPMSVVENFNIYERQSEKLLPQHQDKIIVSNIRQHELINIWISKQLNNGSLLYNYQYGFGAGCQKYDYYEQHEKKYCDNYLSWAKSYEHNVIQVPFIRFIKHKTQKKINSILLINNSWSYYHKMGCFPVLDGTKKNFFDQIKFINLSKKYYKNILIKDTHYSHEIIIKDFDKKINYNLINLNKKNFYHENNLEKFITEAKWTNLIYDESYFPVCSYLGTVFLELMANDIPHVLFYRPIDYNLNKIFKDYMIRLKEFNFIFYNPVNAAKFIINNPNKINDLWNEKNFVNFRKEFRHEFCYIENNKFKTFLDSIK